MWARDKEGSHIPGGWEQSWLPLTVGICKELWPGHSPNGKTPVSHKVMGAPHKPGYKAQEPYRSLRQVPCTFIIKLYRMRLYMS